ncbi:hypothetical protein ACWF7H_25300, partial [Peribacillus butanolivorans]
AQRRRGGSLTARGKRVPYVPINVRIFTTPQKRHAVIQHVFFVLSFSLVISNIWTSVTSCIFTVFPIHTTIIRK